MMNLGSYFQSFWNVSYRTHFLSPCFCTIKTNTRDTKSECLKIALLVFSQLFEWIQFSWTIKHETICLMMSASVCQHFPFNVNGYDKTEYYVFVMHRYGAANLKYNFSSFQRLCLNFRELSVWGDSMFLRMFIFLLWKKKSFRLPTFDCIMSLLMAYVWDNVWRKLSFMFFFSKSRKGHFS